MLDARQSAIWKAMGLGPEWILRAEEDPSVPVRGVPKAIEAPAAPAAEAPARLASVTAIETPQAAPAEEKTMSAAASEKKSFTVIEIPTSEAQTLNKTEDGTPAKPKRTYRRKVAAAE